ncbi:MAG: type II toxin-antitoxin system PemK/MazF family toxin [Candidatus Saccharibacteria bacterium]|nr:type II toxin-antitoxin system PemK/MazF family toxin [Candidatus Saccharibacteria bacterium]
MKEKRFDEWIGIKARLHYIGRIRLIKEGDVWWCAFGENIGVEMNGKSGAFTRPVIVFKKHNGMSFMAIPLTTKLHPDDKRYIRFTFQGKEESAVLIQARTLSVSRLNKRIGRLSNSDMALVRDGFKRYYLKEK